MNKIAINWQNIGEFDFSTSLLLQYDRLYCMFSQSILHWYGMVCP